MNVLTYMSTIHERLENMRNAACETEKQKKKRYNGNFYRKAQLSRKFGVNEGASTRVETGDEVGWPIYCTRKSGCRQPEKKSQEACKPPERQ